MKLAFLGAMKKRIARARILIIEDDSTMRQAIKLLLAPEGYAFDEAADGREAREKLKSGRYELVICDLFLPDTIGLDIFHRCRESHPTLVITGFGDSDTARRAKSEAGALYLEKPFTAAMLKGKVALASGQPKHCKEEK
jgi:DNA-binding response OmpR family regulator